MSRKKEITSLEEALLEIYRTENEMLAKQVDRQTEIIKILCGMLKEQGEYINELNDYIGDDIVIHSNCNDSIKYCNEL